MKIDPGGDSQGIRSCNSTPSMQGSAGRRGSAAALVASGGGLLSAAGGAARLAALGGEKGMTYDALAYGAANILWHLGKYDSITDAADFVRGVLDSGEALKRFNAAS